jgi:hypothetical protein
MNIMRTKIEMKTNQRRNGYPLSYYASENEVTNPKFRSASPAIKITEYGTFRNGRITSMRVLIDES